MIDITLEVDVSDELFFRIHVPVSKGILWSLNHFMLKTKITSNMIHWLIGKCIFFLGGNEGGGGGVMIINDVDFQSCTFVHFCVQF